MMNMKICTFTRNPEYSLRLIEVQFEAWENGKVDIGFLTNMPREAFKKKIVKNYLMMPK